MTEAKKDNGGEEGVLICKEQYGSSSKKNNFLLLQDGRVEAQDLSTGYSSFSQVFRSIFLPQGYPESVSEDYLSYQLWDTCQAFASSITGSLASHALLKGVGVGDEKATVLAATMTWLLKDGAGMLGGIAFAWYKGSSLDCDAKRWRLFADIINDFMTFVSLIAPHLGVSFLLTMCFVGVMRSVVGVSGGATRAALTQHQARRNNMADVSAKDGSQETMVNLAGLLCSLVLLPIVSGHNLMVWILFFAFTSLHLFANYKAVTCVSMESVNQTRLHFIVRRFMLVGTVPSVKEANYMEPVLLPLKRSFKIRLGVSMSDVVASGVTFNTLRSVYQMSMTGYILTINFQQKTIDILLSQSSDTLDQLQACYHAEFLCFIIDQLDKGAELNEDLQKLAQLITECRNSKSINQDLMKSVLSSSLRYVESSVSTLERELHAQGWTTETSLLGSDEWRALWDFTATIGKKTE